MRTTTLALLAAGMMALASLPTVGAHAASVSIPPALVPQVGEPAIQPVWYDRWGRWHPPYAYYGRPRYYGYGYGYGPPHPYGYRHWRRAQCYRWGAC